MGGGGELVLGFGRGGGELVLKLGVAGGSGGVSWSYDLGGGGG